MVLAAIPSPSRGVVHLGPIPLRAYALMIVLGIIVAVVVTARRLRARGADPVIASEVAYWAVPFGIVGARIYHVVSSPDAYFGADGDLMAIFEVWNGGLAIWGAVSGGALGAWLACRRMDVSFGLFADALAPGLALSQAIGRWGNWFNQELYGRATDLPWAVRIDRAHQTIPGVSTYHPTFLYESLWNVGVAGILFLVDRRWRQGRGRLFFLYVALYTVGRLWIEALRIDTAEKVLGLRVNIWVSIVVFLLALVALVLVRRPVDPDIGWMPTPAEGTGAGTRVGAGGSDAGGSDAGGGGAGGSDGGGGGAGDQDAAGGGPARGGGDDTREAEARDASDDSLVTEPAGARAGIGAGDGSVAGPGAGGAGGEPIGPPTAGARSGAAGGAGVPAEPGADPLTRSDDAPPGPPGGAVRPGQDRGLPADTG